MKKKIAFFTLLSFLFMNVNAQYNNGTVYFKDSTELIGFISIAGPHNIKFVPEKQFKSFYYDYKEITGFDIGSDKYSYIENQRGSPQSCLSSPFETFVNHSSQK